MKTVDMNNLSKLSYGLFILTARCDGQDNGCIANTFIQLTSDPMTFGVALNKANLTTSMIRETRLFTVSVLSEDADMDLIGRFGFRSGKEIDKFLGFKNTVRISNGTLAVTRGTNSFISIRVTEMIDLGTHILFTGVPTDSYILSDVPSATYAFYQTVIRRRGMAASPGGDPSAEKEESEAVEKKEIPGTEEKGKAADENQHGETDENSTEVLWKCRICGHIYKGTSLPDGYRCPICGYPASVFEKVL